MSQSQKESAYCCGGCGELVVGGKYADCPNCGGQAPHIKVFIYGDKKPDQNKEEDFHCQNCGFKVAVGAAKEICPSCFGLNSFVRAA